jgi:hypothetical protein
VYPDVFFKIAKLAVQSSLGRRESWCISFPIV